MVLLEPTCLSVDYITGKALRLVLTSTYTQCMTCQKRNIQAVKCAELHFPIPRLPMQFISMYLIGLFDPFSSGYHYALMVVCKKVKGKGINLI